MSDDAYDKMDANIEPRETPPPVPAHEQPGVTSVLIPIRNEARALSRRVHARLREMDPRVPASEHVFLGDCLQTVIGQLAAQVLPGQDAPRIIQPGVSLPNAPLTAEGAAQAARIRAGLAA